jgi:hypothetical protein
MQSDLYRVEVPYIKNTDKFRPAAIHFHQYGFYTSAPKGTTQFYEYWDEETRRSLYGYTTPDGDFISGYFYFYLNYCPILLVTTNPQTGKQRRTRDFPRYYDYDKAYFDAVEEAERVGKHLVVIKKRQAGYSFKGGSMLVRNFFLEPESKSYAISSEAEFLTKDGLLTKAWEFMSFIDEHTAWAKKRQKTDQKMHKVASYLVDVDGVSTETGFRSEIIGVTLKNDIQKARGKRGKLILWEEAGKFPGLKAAWQIAQSSVESQDGSGTFGLMIAYGTGGTDDADYEGLKDLFYEPNAYNALPIENIWDEGANGPCGFFVPQYYNMGDQYMDDDGNSLIKDAMKAELEKRRVLIESATDKRSIDRYIAEKPFNPQEATLQLSGNNFPKEQLIKHLGFIRSHKKVQDQKQVGSLIHDENGLIVWEPSAKPKDLTKYRVEKGTDMSGEIVIWEHPVENPPYGLYIAGIDPYDHDKSGTNSLGSVFIYKRFQDFESYYDMIVAEYTGRPETAEDFYENTLKLLRYYNATALYENEKKGIFQHFTKQNAEYLLADQPDIISDIVQKSIVQRKKGVHMVTAIKDWGEIKIKEYLLENRGDGKLGLHTILSEPLLEELISYNDTGNFDRVMAFMMVIIYREELHKVHVKEKKKENKSNVLFPNGIYLDTIFYD